MQEANRIIAKAERMSLAAIASAIGVDLIAFLALLKRVCEAPEGHIAIKGLQLMARIHGTWEKNPQRGRQVAIILGAPQSTPEPRRVTGLGFVVEVPSDDGGGTIQ